jgi:hypothetical protein
MRLAARSSAIFAPLANGTTVEDIIPNGAYAVKRAIPAWPALRSPRGFTSRR